MALSRLRALLLAVRGCLRVLCPVQLHRDGYRPVYPTVFRLRRLAVQGHRHRMPAEALVIILKALLYFLALVFIGGTVFGCVCTLAAWWVTERVRAGRGSWSAAKRPQEAASAPGQGPLHGSDDPPVAEPLPPIRLECGCYYDGQQSYVCAIHARAWRLH